MKSIKIATEHHNDGYIGYSLGFTKGAVVGQGDTYSDALKDTEDAIALFIEQYGRDKFFEHLEGGNEMREAYIAY